MMSTVGHLVVMFDGVQHDNGWRGQWTIHRPDRDQSAGTLLLVDDGCCRRLKIDPLLGDLPIEN